MSSTSNTQDEVGHPVDTTEYQGAAGEPVGVTDGGQPVVAGPGDGQLSWIDHQRDAGPEERVNPYTFARTTFYANRRDADGEKIDEEKYEKLWKYHSNWDNDSTGRRTHKDKVCVAESLATALNLTKSQTNRVRGIAAHVSGNHFCKNKGIVGLALGAIAYVGEQDVTERARKGLYENPEEAFEDRIVDSDEFEKLCSKYGVDGQEACDKIKEVYHGRL